MGKYDVIVLPEEWLRGFFSSSSSSRNSKYSNLVANLLLAVEALACDSFFKSMGGHVW